MALCSILNVKPKAGNNVSKSNNKTKRSFLLNVQPSTVQSVSGKKKIKLSTKFKKTIVKYGSFDVALLSLKNNKLTDYAKKIKRAILRTDKYKDFFTNKRSA